eukprot:1140885-Pelagomonas_calceolata.AAC.2
MDVSAAAQKQEAQDGTTFPTIPSGIGNGRGRGEWEKQGEGHAVSHQCREQRSEASLRPCTTTVEWRSERPTTPEDKWLRTPCTHSEDVYGKCPRGLLTSAPVSLGAMKRRHAWQWFVAHALSLYPLEGETSRWHLSSPSRPLDPQRYQQSLIAKLYPFGALWMLEIHDTFWNKG